jgi:hypothetical protein
MGLELGLKIENDVAWLRWWDDRGNLLLTGDERAVQSEAIANQERLIANQERLAKEQAEILLQKYRDRYGDISE